MWPSLPSHCFVPGMPTIPDVEMEDADHPDAMEQQPGKTAASDSEEEPAVEDEDIDIEVEPGHCPGCEQKIGTQDQDCCYPTSFLRRPWTININVFFA